MKYKIKNITSGGIYISSIINKKTFIRFIYAYENQDPIYKDTLPISIAILKLGAVNLRFYKIIPYEE